MKNELGINAMENKKNFFERIYDGFMNSKPVTRCIKLLKRIVLPGFDGLCLYEVMEFFFKAIQKDSITEKAGGISYNFFMAIFPGLIFLFTLIPYLPIDNFQKEFFAMLEEFLPEKAYNQAISVMTDILHRQRGGLMSLGFLFTIYFATNGLNAMIGSFNRMHYTTKTRGFISQRLVSLLLFVILTLMIVLCIGLVVGSHFLSNYLDSHHYVHYNITYYFITFAELIILLAFCFFSISFLYYLAPVKKERYRFISAGSTLATILILLASQGFNFYINSFSKYNILYGSIGTLIIFLLFLYFNAMILLIGFELNVSILTAKQRKCGELTGGLKTG
ncbi:MAG: YihY/virulence factor BrkB family protein [Bacteroidia bacterium]|nr:YihY/virulence factor BrkB family protein [Bacteroidia bacterium]